MNQVTRTSNRPRILVKLGQAGMTMAVCAVAVVGLSPSGQSALLPVVLMEQLVNGADAAQERAFVEVERARGLPVRGQTRASVERKFGAPSGSKPPVGQPPISSWSYPEFTVYFEYNHVITTVAKQDYLPVSLGDIQ